VSEQRCCARHCNVPLVDTARKIRRHEIRSRRPPHNPAQFVARFAIQVSTARLTSVRSGRSRRQLRDDARRAGSIIVARQMQNLSAFSNNKLFLPLRSSLASPQARATYQMHRHGIEQFVGKMNAGKCSSASMESRHSILAFIFRERLRLRSCQEGERFDDSIPQSGGRIPASVYARAETRRCKVAVMRALFDDDEVIDLSSCSHICANWRPAIARRADRRLRW